MNKSIIKVILVAIPLLASVPAMAQFDNAFQSTSSMAGSGSQYASDPTYGADGAATYSSIPNRGRTTEVDPRTCDHLDADPKDGICDKCNIEVQIGTGTETPIGPAIPALLLLAGAYTAVIALRRRKQA